MLTLLAFIVTIGLADSVDPTMIVPAVYFAGTARPARSVFGFACGVFAVNLAGGVAVVLGPGRVLLDWLPRPGPAATQVLELAGGCVLVIVGVVLWRRRDRALQSLGDRRQVERAAPIVGAMLALAELPTAVPYLVVIAAVVRARLGVVADVGLLALYQLLYLAPVLAIAALCRGGGEGRASRIERLRELLVRYEGAVIALLLLVSGIVLVVLGGGGLAGW